MSTEENKALDRRLLEEGFSGGNLAVIEELIDENMVDHELSSMGLPSGIEGERQFFHMIRNAFPDLRFTIEDMVAEGDLVVTRSHWAGTQGGDFMGIPAGDKKVTVNAIDIARWKNGKAVEHWAVQDLLGLMQQLGVGKQ